MEKEFKECDTCRKKSGTPVLCSGCIQNRGVILSLQRELADLKLRKYRKDKEVLKLLLGILDFGEAD